MPITLSIGRRLSTVALGSALVLLAAGAPATAAPAAATGPFSITAQHLVLNPTDKGYVGSFDVTITNNSPVADYPQLYLLEPAGASVTSVDPAFGCVFQGLTDNRMRSICGADQLQPGASETFTLAFHVWTTPRPYAMITTGGEVGVLDTSGSGELSDSTGFTTLFRSTTGSLKKPRPYVQAVESDIRATAGPVTLNRLGDGSLEGRMPLTVRYGNDAPSYDLQVEAALPEGVVVDHIEPQDAPSSWTWFSVPGGRFMPGEERTFDVILTAPAGTPAGELGTGSYTATSSYCYCAEVRDVDPADNTTSFPVTAAD